ncbi:methyltransferase [Paramagnetospirillum caucaseum]|uniref:Methyltransferase n=1 Tax=Paramagnetospirillum caucaseum TaxID=1244869 RepID=M3A542_9PROT|nr:class I SAM-dependent methyltransferase [Paramagnetospirillum caucaseum]EME67953.1 methyltransferase [Paramagnetospirillum caucaseum]
MTGIDLKFLCPDCRGRLSVAADVVSCSACGTDLGTVDDGLIVFNGCHDKFSFFEKQAVERLDENYADYNRAAFLDDLKKTDLWEMDEGNKRVGITKKFWWERFVGKLCGKSILELGCGVNYLVPYFLECGNSVVAFDICRESIEYSKRLLTRIGIDTGRIEFAVADARKVEFEQCFDIVDISNVLHHIDDRPAVFARIHRALKDDGKLLIVEPNYYYPPRWILETDVFGPLNFPQHLIIRHHLMEEGEKAVVFRDMIRELEAAGFRLEARRKDDNFLGAFVIRLLRTGSWPARMIFILDRYIFRFLTPRLFASFEFLVLSKS